MRACQPSGDGYVERDGVKVHYEVFGAGEPTVLLLPTWSIIHSRHWKMQVPYLARHCRVLTFDGRGNGHSDRPAAPEAYEEREFAADALAVMDATQTARAIIVGFSMGAQRGLLLAADHPERIQAAVFIGASYPGGGEPLPERTVYSWEEELDTDQSWAKYNRHYWLRDYQGFLEFFMSRMFTEPHSTKPIEDAIGWGLDTTAETLVLTYLAPDLEPDEARELARRVRCPVLVIHGDQDAIRPWASGAKLAEHTGGRLVLLEGSGHGPHVRDPVKVNLLLRDFVKPAPPPRRWVRGRSRRKRALYISSPIGLGHAQRDAAIATELRKLHPDLEIDWLAQHPVTRVLEARGERIHPASALLANESQHIESESAEHDLHCFQAIRRMDEILLANFMVFHDLVQDEQYDLWVGDEAWELDYYLHENPEQKQAAYVWLTDFVGWLPMPDGGEREAFLTADYNAEMIEHIARYPRVRDRAVFVGYPDDIVPDRFGPDLPLIGEWTEQHYAFAGYVTGFDPSDFADRQALRQQLGYRDDEQVCIVTVGGSGVGGHLLRRVIAAFPEAKRRVPALRMVVVTGPRIDPASLPAADGLEVRGFLPGLYRHLAACDLAVVQGGLTTCMELTANRRPFLYFPLQHHFDSNGTSPTGWTATAPGGAWTTPAATPTPSPRPSPSRSAARSTTGRWRPTAPPAPPASSPSCCERRHRGRVPQPAVGIAARDPGGAAVAARRPMGGVAGEQRRGIAAAEPQSELAKLLMEGVAVGVRPGADMLQQQRVGAFDQVGVDGGAGAARTAASWSARSASSAVTAPPWTRRAAGPG